MGTLHMHVGGSGMGNRVKLIHNGLGAVTSVAVAEALAVCVQSGLATTGRGSPRRVGARGERRAG